jgi:restriction system protein
MNVDITATEFEELVHEYLSELGQELKTYHAIHNVIISASDGEYQIDILAEFEFLGANFKVLVECKKHKNPIKREVVQVLHSKLQSTGAHKGMIFSTSPFQSGANRYAEKHGIALIRMIDGRFTYNERSADNEVHEPRPEYGIPKYVGMFTCKMTIFFLNKDNMHSLKDFIFGNENS